MTQSPAEQSNMPAPYKDEELMEACKTGQLVKLEKLLDGHNMQQENQQTINRLFYRAVEYGQISTLQYLHSLYPKFDFQFSSVDYALVNNLDLEMLKLIYSYYPEITQSEFEDHRTLLSRACDGGPQNAPFVEFLVDHGGIRNDGLLYRLPDLSHAIHCDLPTSIIKKMIPQTAILVYPVSAAVHTRRVDVLELLFEELEKRVQQSYGFGYKYWFNEEEKRRMQENSKYGYEFWTKSLPDAAQATRDKQVIALTEAFLNNLKKQGRKWWQLGSG